jgi:hypothetical protein
MGYFKNLKDQKRKSSKKKKIIHVKPEVCWPYTHTNHGGDATNHGGDARMIQTPSLKPAFSY